MEEEGDESSSESESKEKSNGFSRSGQENWLTNFHRDLMAGAVMGGVVHTIVAPIERAKLLLQTQESNIAIRDGPHKRFKGMFDCIVRTVREEGILSLWRGNGSSVLRYYPSVALNFSLKVLFIYISYHLFVYICFWMVWSFVQMIVFVFVFVYGCLVCFMG